MGPLLFLICNNNLPKGLSSNAKLFADDDTSLFAVIHDSSTTRNELNDDLVKIDNWAYQWKMSFNPDPNKQAQEVIFSRKTKKINHPPTFNKSTVSQSTSQKHLGVIRDASLSFEEHLISVQSKTNKTICLLHKLQNTLPRQALITIYKAFVRPHLDYGDILYDQAYNASFHQKLEKIQYSACIAIT